MKTKELAIFSIQSNMLGCTINGKDNTDCSILLSNGKYLTIECDSKRHATDINHALLYYPITEGRANNAREFEFEFTLVYDKKNESILG